MVIYIIIFSIFLPIVLLPLILQVYVDSREIDAMGIGLNDLDPLASD